MTEAKVDYKFQVIMIGDSMVGKSTLLKYFAKRRFVESIDPTIGLDYLTSLIEVESGKMIKLCLWDTAGQERYKIIIKSFYRDTAGVLLLYDICNRTSFEHIPEWMMEVRRHIQPHYCPVFILVGCKLDLVTNDDTRREVSTEEAKTFADEYGMHHIETSAKTGVNVQEVFQKITQEIYNKVESGEYKIGDWKGVKHGFSNPDDFNFTLLEATPEKPWCC